MKAFCDTYLEMNRAKENGSVPSVTEAGAAGASRVASETPSTNSADGRSVVETPTDSSDDINSSEDLGSISKDPTVDVEVIGGETEELSSETVEGVSRDAKDLISANAQSEGEQDIKEEVPVEEASVDEAPAEEVKSAYSKFEEPAKAKGIRAFGRAIGRHPWRTATLAVAGTALATTVVALVPAVGVAALVPKIAVYGLALGTAGTFAVSGITTGIARGASKRYNRFCHNYDFETQQRKIARKIRKRDLTISRIEDQLSEIAAVEGVVIPDYTKVSTTNASLNRKFDKNAAKIVQLQELLNNEASMDLAGMSKNSRKRVKKLVRQLNRLDHDIVRKGGRAGSKIAKIESLDTYTGQHIEEDRIRRRGLRESIKASVVATAEADRARAIASASKRDVRRARSINSEAERVMV